VKLVLCKTVPYGDGWMHRPSRVELDERWALRMGHVGNGRRRDRAYHVAQVPHLDEGIRRCARGDGYPHADAGQKERQRCWGGGGGGGVKQIAVRGHACK